MAQACWNSVLARRRPALQRHTWQAGHSVCCVWGIFQKTRRLQLLPSSFPSSLVSSAFLPPCLLPFVRVGSVRLARNGFDVWLPFSVGRGIFKGLPYDCGPEMFCSQCRSPAPQAPARGEGAPSVIRLLGIVAHQAILIQAKPLQPVDIIIADSAPRRRARRGHLPRPATAAMGRGAKGAGGVGPPAAPHFVTQLQALRAQVQAQQATLDETHKLVSNNGEGLKAEYEKMKRYFDEARDAVDDALAKARADIDRKLRGMDEVIDRNGAQFKLNAAKYRERAEEAFAEARKAQENQARETARFKQTVQDLATLDKHVTTCFTTAMKRNDELKDELQDGARDYANVINQLETLKEQVAHLQQGVREKNLKSRSALLAQVAEMDEKCQEMDEKCQQVREELGTFAYNVVSRKEKGREAGGVVLTSIDREIGYGQEAAELLRCRPRAVSAPPGGGRHPPGGGHHHPGGGHHHLSLAAAADESGASDCRREMQCVQVLADQTLATPPPLVLPLQPTADKMCVPPPPLVLPPVLPAAMVCPAPPHEEPHGKVQTDCAKASKRRQRHVW